MSGTQWLTELLPRTATSDITSRLVGASIRDVRRRRGLTQVQVAERLKTSPPYVSSLEGGRENVTIGQLTAIAEALEVELHLELRIPVAREEPVIPEASD